jgi:DNA processing protein
MPIVDSATRALLRLTLTPGLGPVLIGRAVQEMGSYEAAADATEPALRRIRGIGEERARAIAEGLRASNASADAELRLADTLGVALVPMHDPAYPPLLRQLSDAPPLLYVRGRIDPDSGDRYPIAIVGSRSCTAYGVEQSERFGAALAQCGLTIVSGGARGIDTAAHRAAVRVKGRTVAVLGCGLAHCYPPDNTDLFETIAESHGAVVSELPLNTPPNAENFPARNRIISGMSLGVLVIEAGRRSGALITARIAAEEHGREVFAVPARVDSASSAGSLDLLKAGGAALVTHPDDILQALESPARHAHQGTHEARFKPMQGQLGFAVAEADAERPTTTATRSAAASPRDAALTPEQHQILAALTEPRSLDDLARIVSRDVGALRADITVLEIRRRLERRGAMLVARSARST